MTDTEKQIQQRPLPADDGELSDEEDEKQANRLAIGFAIFLPIGLVIGLTVLDNIGLGVAIGLAMGGVYSLLGSKFIDERRVHPDHD